MDYKFNIELSANERLAKLDVVGSSRLPVASCNSEGDQKNAAQHKVKEGGVGKFVLRVFLFYLNTSSHSGLMQ